MLLPEGVERMRKGDRGRDINQIHASGKGRSTNRRDQARNHHGLQVVAWVIFVKNRFESRY